VWRSSSSTSAVKQTGFVSATASDGSGDACVFLDARRWGPEDEVLEFRSAVGQRGCGEGPLCD
jgi:hypothetical protein